MVFITRPRTYKVRPKKIPKSPFNVEQFSSMLNAAQVKGISKARAYSALAGVAGDLKLEFSKGLPSQSICTKRAALLWKEFLTLVVALHDDRVPEAVMRMLASFENIDLKRELFILQNEIKLLPLAMKLAYLQAASMSLRVHLGLTISIIEEICPKWKDVFIESAME